MSNSRRTFIASAVTVAAIGGLAWAGTQMRSAAEQTPAAAAVKVKPKVIHKRRVKKVNVPASGGGSAGGAPAAYSSGYSGSGYSASQAPAVVPAAPTKPAVVTQPSPSGGSGYEDDEHEEPEHESEDD